MTKKKTPHKHFKIEKPVKHVIMIALVLLT